MGNNVNTPYDDVFRTLLNDCPDLIIPVINATFGTSFVMGQDVVTKGNNEFFSLSRMGSRRILYPTLISWLEGKIFILNVRAVQMAVW